jgi:hypothetical protein
MEVCAGSGVGKATPRARGADMGAERVLRAAGRCAVPFEAGEATEAAEAEAEAELDRRSFVASRFELFSLVARGGVSNAEDTGAGVAVGTRSAASPDGVGTATPADGSGSFRVASSSAG